MYRHITPFVLLFVLSACSSAEDNSQNKAPQNTKKEHMLSDQEKILQKAKDTEKLIEEAHKKQKKAIDDASK